MRASAGIQRFLSLDRGAGGSLLQTAGGEPRPTTNRFCSETQCGRPATRRSRRNSTPTSCQGGGGGRQPAVIYGVHHRRTRHRSREMFKQTYFSAATPVHGEKPASTISFKDAVVDWFPPQVAPHQQEQIERGNSAAFIADDGGGERAPGSGSFQRGKRSVYQRRRSHVFRRTAPPPEGLDVEEQHRELCVPRRFLGTLRATGQTANRPG